MEYFSFSRIKNLYNSVESIVSTLLYNIHVVLQSLYMLTSKYVSTSVIYQKKKKKIVLAMINFALSPVFIIYRRDSIIYGSYVSVRSWNSDVLFRGSFWCSLVDDIRCLFVPWATSLLTYLRYLYEFWHVSLSAPHLDVSSHFL